MEITKEYILRLSPQELESLLETLPPESPAREMIMREMIMREINMKISADELLLEDTVV